MTFIPLHFVWNGFLPLEKHITKVDLVKCLIHLEHPYALKSRKTFRKSWFVFGQIHQTPHYTPLTDFKQASCAPTFCKSEVINCTWASHSPRRTIGITQKKGISPSPPTQKLSLCLWYVSHMVQQAANWRRVIVREQYALGSNVQILALFQGYHNIGSARD